MYNLKRVRQENGFSQSDLAKASGVPIRKIQTYEAESPVNHRDINKGEALQVWRMAQVLGVDITEILEMPEDGELDD